MATRMQQRRGLASQWISTNGGDGPVLNAGEIGYETDTNKFKIGDGVSPWADLNYFLDAVALGGSIDDYIPLTDKGAVSGVAALDASKNVIVPGASIIVEGATDNAYDTTLTVVDPTANRTITFPNATGTVITTGNLSDITNIGVFTSTITMEGSTADAYELTLSAGDPTADRTITFPDETGTVQLRVSDVSDTEIGYLNGVTSAIQTQMDAKAPLASPTFTGTVTIPAGASISGFAPLAAPALTGDATAVNLTVSGNLTVNGTTTNINSTNLVVEDKNIVLADVTTPTDTTADGGGLTLKGLTDKTFNWVNATDAWTSSEHINLASAKTLKYNGTDLVAAQTVSTTLNPDTAFPSGAVVAASLGSTISIYRYGPYISTDLAVFNNAFPVGTSVTLNTPSNGDTTVFTVTSAATIVNDAIEANITITSGTATNFGNGDAFTMVGVTSNSGKYLTTNGTSTSWATVAGYSAPTLGSTSIASGATVTTIEGLTDIVLNGPGSVTDELTLLLMGAL